MDKLPLLFIALFCTMSSFFIGYYFGNGVSSRETADLKHSLQVSLQLNGNILRVEKSHPDIVVVANGETLSGTGILELKKE